MDIRPQTKIGQWALNAFGRAAVSVHKKYGHLLPQSPARETNPLIDRLHAVLSAKDVAQQSRPADLLLKSAKDAAQSFRHIGAAADAVSQARNLPELFAPTILKVLGGRFVDHKNLTDGYADAVLGAVTTAAMASTNPASLLAVAVELVTNLLAHQNPRIQVAAGTQIRKLNQALGTTKPTIIKARRDDSLRDLGIMALSAPPPEPVELALAA